MNDDAAGGRAALTGGAKAAPQASIDGKLEIRVIHDHDDVLAAHLEMRLFEGRRRPLRHRPADLGRAGERHDANLIAHEESLADFRARSRDEIHDARRDASLPENPDEVERRQRREAGRLQDDGVAEDERRHDLPRWDRHRKIPRRDQAADAERLADRHRELVPQLGGNGLPGLAAPFSRHEERHVDGFLHVATRLVENLAHLARHVPRERLLPVRDELRGAKQHLRPPRRRDEPPAEIRPRRRVNRLLHILARGLLEQANQIAGLRGIVVLEQLP